MATSSDRQGSLGRQMFRESALKKMNSAEDLDAYLRLVNPSAWVLVGAVACLLVAAAIWACTASLPIRYSTTGVIKDGQMKEFGLKLGQLTDAEREIILDGCLINYNRV